MSGVRPLELLRRRWPAPASRAAGELLQASLSSRPSTWRSACGMPRLRSRFARASQGAAAGRGVERHRVAARRLAQLGGNGFGGSAAVPVRALTGLMRPSAAGRRAVGVGDLAVRADHLVPREAAGGQPGQRTAAREAPAGGSGVAGTMSCASPARPALRPMGPHARPGKRGRGQLLTPRAAGRRRGPGGATAHRCAARGRGRP